MRSSSMHSEIYLNRRAFCLTIGGALAARALGAEAEKRSPLIGFIKPFQKLSYSEIADYAAEIGWDGVECPVRKGGTVEPSSVEEELPKFVEIMGKSRLSVPVIATDVEDVSNLSEKVLRTAGSLGIRQYRLKHYYYDLNKRLEPQINDFKSKLRDLSQLNRQLKVQGTIQNHSGRNYVGAPVWDIWELIRELDPNDIATYFDIGHATVEGGYSWPLHARIVQSSLAVVSVKDFLWRKGEKNRWEAEWCPLGEGMVRPEFFQYLSKSGFRGPISTHFEYKLGEGKAMIAAMKKDLAELKGWL